MLHNTIGERLKRMMAERDFSAAQLAKSANVKPSFIYDVIHGKSTNPSIVKLANITKVLNVDISSLVGNETPPPAAEKHSKTCSRLNMHNGSIHTETDYVAIPSTLVKKPASGETPVITTEAHGTPYYFRKEWIRDQLGVSHTDLRMIFVCGDNMEPTLYADDIILVDITKKTPTPSGIFVLFDGFSLIVKRLELIPNSNPLSVWIISDNLQYSAYERTISELHIIGRVVWFAREL